jgi:hypothetical protein
MSPERNSGSGTAEKEKSKTEESGTNVSLTD